MSDCDPAQGMEAGYPMLSRFGLALFLLVPAGAYAGWTSPAPEVVLYADPAMASALQRVAAGFSAERHIGVHLFIAPPSGLLGLIRHRARDDVVVADAATINQLTQEHLVEPQSVVAIGSDAFVLIGNDGAAPADGLTAAQLVASHVTVLTDATTEASFDGAAVLRAAVPDVATPRVSGVANTPTVVAEVRGDSRLLGLVHLTEAALPGVAQVAKLAVPPTEIMGAVAVNSQSGNAAALLAYIAGPGRAALRRAGLDVKS